jgi:hypothetical protein
MKNKTLDYIINILKTYYVYDSKEVNSVYALIPMMVYAHQKKYIMSVIEQKIMMQRFYYSQIKNRYISQLQQKLDSDIKVIQESENPF